MDKLRALRFFCRVAETKSFAAAAHDLHIVPSVLSKSISGLEAGLRFKLFNRTTRHVSLTEDGARYYETCKRLLGELEEAELAARQSKNRPTGRLLAGLHPAINKVMMTRTNEFLEQYPDIVLETTMTSMLSTIVDDRLDVLIALGDLSDSSFSVQSLGVTRHVLVASPMYLDVRGQPQTPGALRDHSFIVSGRPDGGSFARWTMAHGTSREIVYAPARLVSRQGIHMHEACLSGAGITRLAEFSIRHQIDSGALVVVLPEWSLGTLPIRAVYPSRKSVPAKVRVFVEFARKVLNELGVK